jgi:hypothetical protein
MLDYVNTRGGKTPVPNKNRSMIVHDDDQQSATLTTKLPRFMAPTIGRMNKANNNGPQNEPVDLTQ